MHFSVFIYLGKSCNEVSSEEDSDSEDDANHLIGTVIVHVPNSYTLANLHHLFNQYIMVNI